MKTDKFILEKEELLKNIEEETGYDLNKRIELFQSSLKQLQDEYGFKMKRARFNWDKPKK